MAKYLFIYIGICNVHNITYETWLRDCTNKIDILMTHLDASIRVYINSTNMFKCILKPHIPAHIYIDEHVCIIDLLNCVVHPSSGQWHSIARITYNPFKTYVISDWFSYHVNGVVYVVYMELIMVVYNQYVYCMMMMTILSVSFILLIKLQNHRKFSIMKSIEINNVHNYFHVKIVSKSWNAINGLGFWYGKLIISIYYVKV